MLIVLVLARWSWTIRWAGAGASIARAGGVEQPRSAGRHQAGGGPESCAEPAPLTSLRIATADVLAHRLRARRRLLGHARRDRARGAHGRGRGRGARDRRQ